MIFVRAKAGQTVIRRNGERANSVVNGSGPGGRQFGFTRSARSA